MSEFGLDFLILYSSLAELVIQGEKHIIVCKNDPRRETYYCALTYLFRQIYFCLYKYTMANYSISLNGKNGSVQLFQIFGNSIRVRPNVKFEDVLGKEFREKNVSSLTLTITKT